MKIDSFFSRRDSTLSAYSPNERPSLFRKMRKFFNYKPEKWWGYIVCLITFIVTLAIGMLALISKSSLYFVIFGDTQNFPAHVLVLILIFDFWIFSFNAALFYGIKYNAVLIFLWIITMLINWNIYVFARLVHLVDYAMKVSTKVKDLYIDIGHFYLIIGIWLLMISIIWDYWQSISNITDIPELIEFLVTWHTRSHMPIPGESPSLGGSEYTSPGTSRY
ncbi:uncharacterized protein LOC123684673 isoform X2 [Harmonia axyridis]|uniref:uncharacterized protein LOC123684673 isoform X2 n=1 Tax=Harmonia axyridis TaxID=115357 RepID=UPI001E2766FD|nr:uncharacterized protein LOC123684673 isoform X2 [Harmonia axyridis]